MKNKKWILTAVAILIMSVVFASPKVEKTDIKNCEITKTSIIVNKDVKAIWTLNYNADSPITVVKHKNLDGTQYVVHSKYFDVTYAATETGFGTVDMMKSFTMVNKKISKAVINYKEWEKQKVLTTDKVTDEIAIGLISSYLPDLINEGYVHLLLN